VSSETSLVGPQATPSTRTNRSTKISLSEGNHRDVLLSSVPKHMKSTSSRFSFDMIGAAKQEKLLEERHRQKAAEKKVVEPVTSNVQRDSRFDDLDDFDYDAMMDDDGLEEPIPGVNADYDDFEEPVPGVDDDYDEDPIPMIGEEEYQEPIPGVHVEEAEESVVEVGGDTYDDEGDPDNDQENFAGFVFQRSNPHSALTSPQSAGMMATPRDAEGHVIGFAMSKDGPDTPARGEPRVVSSPTLGSEAMPHLDPEPAGLGIQGLSVSDRSPTVATTETTHNSTIPPFVERRNRAPDDDLYYNDGMLGLEGEVDNEFVPGDDAHFDESIFDHNDTDEYGRPIPGAFARAQAAMLAAQNPENQSKRASDITSRLSAQSAVSESTGYTSVSVGGQLFVSASNSKLGSEEISPRKDVMVPPMPTLNAKEQEYQAALAAAAHKAAASGKFRRDSSPPLPTAKSQARPAFVDDMDLFEEPDDKVDFDDYEKDDLDDYELDVDAIIAEANASALANDSDGWYGQEFGFYSAPTQQHHASNGPSYMYSNGGYFGPSGVGRTISGRAISREPNLTPITERSEYSNRNSIMSLLPPAIGSGHSSLHSPGLAQLAMMAEGSSTDDMTLSALLRLRSRAWGGSQASLVSSKDGSPRSERADGANSPWGPGPSNLSVGGHRMHERKNSTFSVVSRDSEPVSESGSPTLTMNVPVITSSPPPVPPPVPPFQPIMSSEPAAAASAAAAGSWMGPPPLPLNAKMTPTIMLAAPPARRRNTDPPAFLSDANVFLPVLSPVTPVSPLSKSTDFTGLVAPPRSPNVNATSPPPPSPGTAAGPSPLTRGSGGGGGRMGHRHKGSADSISYVPYKQPESGETRWLVQRNRMDEDGNMEPMGPVEDGGRI
jgi:hypothetical protein